MVKTSARFTWSQPQFLVNNSLATPCHVSN